MQPRLSFITGSFGIEHSYACFLRIGAHSESSFSEWRDVTDTFDCTKLHVLDTTYSMMPNSVTGKIQ